MLLADNLIKSGFISEKSKNGELPQYREVLAPRESTEAVDLAGIEDLQVIGSAQPNEAHLRSVQAKLPSGKTLCLVNLRAETNLFVDEQSIFLANTHNQANLNKTCFEIELEESQFKEKLEQEKQVQLYQWTEGEHFISGSAGELLTFSSVKREIEIAAKLAIPYYRFPVVDHQRPNDNIVQDFLEFYKNLDDNQILWLHCKGGKGRTSTFITMIDMIKHYDHFTLEQIFERQKLINGRDLRKTTYHYPFEWKAPFSKERIDFLKDFYHYLHECGVDGKTWLDYQTVKKAVSHDSVKQFRALQRLMPFDPPLEQGYQCGEYRLRSRTVKAKV